ncbi:MAG: class I SAM-dependent methyltransferase, partial [Acidimicrobiales bacterium]
MSERTSSNGPPTGSAEPVDAGPTDGEAELGNRSMAGFVIDPLVTHLTSQFSRPRGQLGMVAGRIMSRRGSNVDRNLWLVGLLDLQPDHRVLELGPGPGIALAAAAKTVTVGELVALDHSVAMLRQTATRTADVVDQGRLKLVEAAAED